MTLQSWLSLTYICREAGVSACLASSIQAPAVLRSPWGCGGSQVELSGSRWEGLPQSDNNREKAAGIRLEVTGLQGDCSPGLGPRGLCWAV